MTGILYLDYSLLLLISILVGFINTLVGSGSLVMLPILFGFGLPGHVANGTNRVAVVVQSLIGSLTFFRKKKFSFWQSRWVIIPCLIGAQFGVELATRVPPDGIKSFVGILMILMLFVILINPKRWFKEESLEAYQNSKKPLVMLMMFAIGFYGGFIQAGVGIFLLMGLVLGVKYSLGQANAIKLIIVALYAVPVLIRFAISDQVDWFLGGFTAVGQGFGAYLGARFATSNPNANVWIYRLLVTIVLASIIYFYHSQILEVGQHLFF